MRSYLPLFCALLMAPFCCCQVGYNPVTVKYEVHYHIEVETDTASMDSVLWMTSDPTYIDGPDGPVRVKP